MKKLRGYYVVSNEIKLVVNNTGIDETILESIVNEYNSTMSTVENIATLNPSALQSNIFKYSQIYLKIILKIRILVETRI